MAVSLNAAMAAGNQGTCNAVGNALSFSTTGITIAAGSNRALVVTIGWMSSSGIVAPATRSATWNSVAMTEVAFLTAGANNASIGIYVLVNPATGAQTLAGSWVGLLDAYVGAVCWNGADQTTGIATGDTVTGTATTISVTGSTDGATVATILRDGTTTASVPSRTIFWNFDGNFPGGTGAYDIGTSGSVAFDFSGGSDGGSRALAAVHVIAAAGGTPDQPPSQVYLPDSSDNYEPSDLNDGSATEFYADLSVPNRADVIVDMPFVELPQSGEWEDPNQDEALWLWPLAQAPPPDDVVDQLGNEFDGYFGEEDELEGFADLPQGVGAAAPDYVQPELGEPQPDEEDQQVFTDAPLPPDNDVAASRAYDASEQYEPEDEDFTFLALPLPADVSPDQIYAEDATQQPPDPEDEDFAFAAAPAPADVLDPLPVEDATQQPPDPEDEDFAFIDAPLAEDAPQLALVEDATQQPPDPEDEDFGLSLAPQADDVVDPQPVEDASTQLPYPEDDEDFSFSAGPAPDDVIDLNIVWQDDAANQIDTPDDEAFDFTADPLPDDVTPPPPTGRGQLIRAWLIDYYEKAWAKKKPEPKPVPELEQPRVTETDPTQDIESQGKVAGWRAEQFTKDFDRISARQNAIEVVVRNSEERLPPMDLKVTDVRRKKAEAAIKAAGSDLLDFFD